MFFFNSLLSLELSPRARGFIVDISINLEAHQYMEAHQVVDACSTMSLKKTMNELKAHLDSGDLSLDQINDIQYIYKLVLTCIK